MPIPQSPSGPRKRVRCHAIDTQFLQDSRCQVRVEVEWSAGSILHGESNETDTAHGRMRAGALAAIAAAEAVTEGQLRLELRGVKLVRAFDSLLIVVAVRAQGPDRRYDLIGTTVAPNDDLVRGAALALLDATNRVLELYVPQPTAVDDVDEPPPNAAGSPTPSE